MAINYGETIKNNNKKNLIKKMLKNYIYNIQ